MMNDSDSQITFIRLSEILRELGLGWLVEQVNQRISEGKIVIEQVQIEDNDQPDEKRLRRRPKTKTIPVVKQYTPQEQLELLLDGVERGVIQALSVKKAVADYFANEARLHQMNIHVELWSGENARFLSVEDNLRLEAQTQHLQSLVARLRREINSGSSR